MEVRMEHTGGLGKAAEVWLGRDLYCVCDGISRPGQRVRPGVLENVRFAYVSDEKTAWPLAKLGNPDRKKALEPVRNWSYVGYGQVVSIMPVVIDFGVLTMEDANWTNDNSLIGRFVRIGIDRLEISPAHAPDWPADCAPPAPAAGGER